MRRRKANVLGDLGALLQKMGEEIKDLRTELKKLKTRIEKVLPTRRGRPPKHLLALLAGAELKPGRKKAAKKPGRKKAAKKAAGRKGAKKRGPGRPPKKAGRKKAASVLKVAGLKRRGRKPAVPVEAPPPPAADNQVPETQGQE